MSSAVASSVIPSVAPTTVSAPFAAVTGNATTAVAAAKTSSMDPNELVVYWLDITLLCVVAVFFFAALPCLLPRLARVTDPTRGVLLRSGASRPTRNLRRQNTDATLADVYPRKSGRLQRQDTNVTLADVSRGKSGELHRQNTDATLAEKYPGKSGGLRRHNTNASTSQSHTLAAHDYYPMSGKGVPALPGRSNPPAHIPSLATLLHPVSFFFLYSVTPGKSIGKLFLLLLYVIAIVVVTFLMSGKPLTDSVRLGWIATSQIPVVIALGTKNNVVGMLVGMGYERLNYLHRFVGITIFVTANVHALGFFYKWAIAGTLNKELSQIANVRGLTALIGVELLFLSSLDFIRRRAYKLFIFTHVAGIATLLISLCLHRAGCVLWIMIAIVIYALDHLIRLVKTRVTTARISTVPELGLTRVELPTITTGWRAASTIAHPFTIANAADNGQGLTLLVKKAGAWTNNLYEAAGRAGYYASDEGLGTSREIRVAIEGPYGGLGGMVVASFSAAMLVTGGSGITFALSQAEELVRAVREGKSALRSIEIVWTTQDMASVSPLMTTFSELIEAMSSVPGVLLKISVFYSRASTRAVEKGNSAAAYISSLAPSLEVQPGRPPLSRMLDVVVRRTSSLRRACGVAVGVCGPIELVQDVVKTARGVDSELRSACGGVEVHEEVFGL